MKKDSQIISFGQIEVPKPEEFKMPDLKNCPILPTRNLVLFPGTMLPLGLMRPMSVRVAEMAHKHRTLIGLCCQIDPEQETPLCAGDLAGYGVFIEVLKIFDLPDNQKSALVHARGKFKVKADAAVPTPDFLTMEVTRVADPVGELKPEEERSFVEILKSSAMDFFRKANAPMDQVERIKGLQSLADTVNNIATFFPGEPEKKIELLATYGVVPRGQELLKFIDRETQHISIMSNIMERAREELSDEQKEVFMRRQMEVIQQELYGDSDDAEQLTARAEKVHFPKEVRDTFDKSVAQLRRQNPSTPDYAVLYNYLTMLLELPWGVYSETSRDLPKAAEVLDENHYGMAKVKERIVEQLAAEMSNPDGKAPILCLVGAPGVGKTSLGVSVAKALGREYQRVSLGGVSDEAEIRGHRRTYIGAMPGRIIDAMRRAGRQNPVLLLDEVDKIQRDVKGDPSAALLEVLDPEQNCKFHDNYIDVDYDLSKVMFIATANSLDTVPRPLLDRMEVIEVPGYLLEEKIEIARRHLLPRILRELGMEAADLELDRDAIVKIIESYTSESGVRQLEKALKSVGRKLLVKKMSGHAVEGPVTASTVAGLLGPARFSPTRYETMDLPGVVTGLAWTANGGEILFIESSLAKSKGEKLTLTGNLGDVMKESATIALQFVRAHADTLGIDPAIFDDHILHIHVPEGAVPKDGPSAGITMAVSIASTLTGRKVKPRLAMTGEITLRGRVLPVGGIKEKILAAKRAGITDIIICEENRPDIEAIEPNYLDGVTFHYVRNVSDVLALSLQ